MAIEENKVEIQTTIRHRDYRAVAYFNLFQRHRYEPYVLLAVVSLAVVVLVSAALPWFQTNTVLFHISWVALTFLALLLLITEILVHQYIRSDRKMFHSSYAITVTEQGLQVVTSGGKAEYTWKRMFQGFELRSHFLFFLNISQAVILPKRCMTDKQCRFVRQTAQKGMAMHFQRRYRPATLKKARKARERDRQARSKVKM